MALCFDAFALILLLSSATRPTRGAPVRAPDAALARRNRAGLSNASCENQRWSESPVRCRRPARGTPRLRPTAAGFSATKKRQRSRRTQHLRQHDGVIRRIAAFLVFVHGRNGRQVQLIDQITHKERGWPSGNQSRRLGGNSRSCSGTYGRYVFAIARSVIHFGPKPPGGKQDSPPHEHPIPPHGDELHAVLRVGLVADLARRLHDRHARLLGQPGRQHLRDDGRRLALHARTHRNRRGPLGQRGAHVRHLPLGRRGPPALGVHRQGLRHAVRACC